MDVRIMYGTASYSTLTLSIFLSVVLSSGCRSSEEITFKLPTASELKNVRQSNHAGFREGFLQRVSVPTSWSIVKGPVFRFKGSAITCLIEKSKAKTQSERAASVMDALSGLDKEDMISINKVSFPNYDGAVMVSKSKNPKFSVGEVYNFNGNGMIIWFIVWHEDDSKSHIDSVRNGLAVVLKTAELSEVSE